MKLTYLGTAASEGWPALFCGCPICRRARQLGGKDLRLRTSALVDEDLLLDLSPDLLGAMQRIGADLSHVRHVVLTHCHGDHFAVGMLHWFGPGFNRTAPEEPLYIYGSPVAHQRLMEQLALGDGSAEQLHFVEVRPYETVPGDAQTFLTALPAFHGNERTGAQTYLIERGSRRLIYLHDTGKVTADMLDFLRSKPAHIVSMDATIGPLPAAKAHGHMGFEQLADIRRQMLACGAADAQTVFVASHICIHACYDVHRQTMLFHDDMAGLLAPQGLCMAYDGLCVDAGC